MIAMHVTIAIVGSECLPGTAQEQHEKYGYRNVDVFTEQRAGGSSRQHPNPDRYATRTRQEGEPPPYNGPRARQRRISGIETFHVIPIHTAAGFPASPEFRSSARNEPITEASTWFILSLAGCRPATGVHHDHHGHGA